MMKFGSKGSGGVDATVFVGKWIWWVAVTMGLGCEDAERGGKKMEAFRSLDAEIRF